MMIESKSANPDTDQSNTATEEGLVKLKTGFNVQLDDFSGPIELLFSLIKESEMDVFTISLSSITDQYLEHISHMNELDLGMAGEYLVIASALLLIKARSLLPSEEALDLEEEMDEQELIQRLAEYKRFKQVAEMLREQELEKSQLFSRGAPEREVTEVEMLEVSIYDLVSAFKRAMADIGEQPLHITYGEDYTVDEKIVELRSMVRREGELDLLAYLQGMKSRMEIVVTFLALLEVMRMQLVKVVQRVPYGEIILMHTENVEDERED